MDLDTEPSSTPALADEFEDDIWPQQHETAYRVYNDLWNDFYDWEREHCLEALSELSRPTLRYRDLPNPSAVESDYFPSHDVEYFVMEDYDPRTGRVTSSTLAAEPFLLQQWRPYQRYNSCTSASRNVPATPVNGHLRISFIPLADDVNFDFDDYLEDFEDFKWQNDFIDPDLEVIQLETARRLHYIHRFPFSAIDNLGIFNFQMREASNKGLIWCNAQRDLLAWPTFHTEAISSLPTNFVDRNTSLLQDITKDIVSFCPRLNCLHPFCGLHGSANPIILPQVTKPNEEMKEDGKDSCLNDCYKLADFDNIILTNEDWDENDHALFNDVVQLAPDTLPCDLAIICRKPCYEIFIQRLNMFRDEDITFSDDRVGKLPSQFKFEEDVPENLPIMLVQPCYHAGPCNSHICQCFRAKRRCQRSCRCSDKCKLRYKGCRCHKRGRKSATCNDITCRCRQLMRECDPEACRKCDARHGQCSNTNLQRGKFTNVYIKKGRHGLGAFAVKDIKQGSCIGEYTGEFYLSHEYDHLSILQKYTGSNYAFDLVAGKTVLDSAYLGNETRYLNHSTLNSNCRAEVLLVNGDQRIIFIAERNIKADEELTLNYGLLYWEGKPPPE